MMDHNTAKCFALVKRDGSLNQCSFKKKKGDFCGKHYQKLRRTRVDDYKKILEVLNVKAKLVTLQDYLDDRKLKSSKLIDIYYTLKLKNPDLECNMWAPSKLRNRLITFYDNFVKTRKHIPSIVKLQRSFRRQRNLRLLIKHGPCYFQRQLCNNQEDFYTLDEIEEIPNKFFFSFRDQNGFYYGFDIRSLNQLITQKTPNNTSNKQIANPYTTNSLRKETIARIKNLVKNLESSGVNLQIHSEKELTKEQNTRQSVVKVFSLIDQLGYQTDVEWLLSMSLHDLKALYRLIEDIWNYRSELTNENKKEINPNESEHPLFHNPVQYVMNSYDYDEVLKINLEVFERLVTESDSIVCQSLGALYILTSLVGISTTAALAYPDLVQPNDHED